jgi:hypothetical protein
MQAKCLMPCSQSPLVTVTSSCYISLIFSTFQSFPPLYVCLSGDLVISGFQIENLYTSHTYFMLATCTIQSVTLTIHVWCRSRWLRGQRRVPPSTTRISLAISNFIQDTPYAAFLRHVTLCRKVVDLRWADPTPLNAYQMWKKLIVLVVNRACGA